MIILTQRELEKKEELEELIQKEKRGLLIMIESQKLKRSTLSDAMEKINNFIKNNKDNVSEKTEIILNNFKNSLALSETNLFVLDSLLNDLNGLDRIINKYTDKKVREIEKYNKIFTDVNKIVSNNTTQIDQTLNYILTFSESIFEDIDITNKVAKKSVKKSTKTINKKLIKELDLKKHPENTLVVSEKENLVYLPFYLEDINEIYMDNLEQYTGFKQILEEKYTVSLDRFKSPAISRFKEAFKLMRLKENETVIKSFELGIELFFNYNLHPAIIAASRSLEELKKYLYCLERNETQNFEGFKIIFDMAPIEIKTANVGLINLKNDTVKEMLEVELESKAIDLDDIKEEENAKNINEAVIDPEETIIRRNEDYNLYSEEERAKQSKKRKNKIKK